MERGYTALMPSDLSHALFTDLYELTMAQAFWRRGMDARASFSLFFRSLPPGRSYLVAAGVEECLDHLASLRFTPEDLTHLHTLGLFDAAFLDTLGGLRFTGEARCVEEGEIVFANGPIIEVSAPIIEAQIVETYLLNRVGFQTLMATKAARTAHAAAGRAVVDFGARRAHGLDAAAALARLTYLTGFDGTSNVRAGVRYGIPVRGTMAHSFVMSFESEAGAFRAYAEAFPDSATLLIDTYDPVEGISAAIEAARDLRRRGSELRAVRIDSGDLAALSILARRRLDDDGFPGVSVFVSGGLDETAIERLLRDGAPIDGFGVGTSLAVSSDAPAPETAYKLVEYAGRPVMKLSEAKSSLPGVKQVFRRFDGGMMDGDVIGLASESTPPDASPLLRDAVRGGERVAAAPALANLRDRFRERFATLSDDFKRLESPPVYPVEISQSLASLRDSTAAALEGPA